MSSGETEDYEQQSLIFQSFLRQYSEDLTLLKEVKKHAKLLYSIALEVNLK
jgi:hypothetical protein